MSKEWKVYTKTGDKGTTALIGGKRVAKNHPQIEAYGTVDELNAFVGLLRDQEIDSRSKKILTEIQERLFVLESQIAVSPGKEVKSMPVLHEKDVQLLEFEIDMMNETLPPLTAFVLPGGHPVVSYCHVCRTVCRRAERLVIGLADNYPVDAVNIRYLNRLSDYFFVLGRKLARDMRVDEILWKPRK